MLTGEITAALMKAEGLTLEALAARVRAAGAGNVRYQHIQQLLDIPTRRPRFLPELAQAFGMTVEQFLAYKPGGVREELGTYKVPGGPSQHLGIDADILAASNMLVRLACEHLELVHDPEDPDDAKIILLGYAYLKARGQSQVTPDNLVDFTKVLRAQIRGVADDRREESTGGAGRSASREGKKRKAG